MKAIKNTTKHNTNILNPKKWPINPQKGKKRNRGNKHKTIIKCQT